MRILFLLTSTTILLNALSLPSTIYKSNYNITPESNYTIYKKVQKAKELYIKGKRDESAKIFIDLLKKAAHSNSDKNIDQYDYLISNIALLDILKDKDDNKNYKLLARKVISFLDKNTNKGKDIWEEGDLGKLQLKIYKSLLDNYAKILYKESNRDDDKLLKKALYYANRAQKFIRSEEDNYLKETKLIIQNAIDKNPPLDIEKEVQIIKHIDTKDENLSKSAL